MSRERAPNLNFDDSERNEKSSRGERRSRNAFFRSAYPPPPCLVSAVALGLMIGSSSAIAGAGSCTATGSDFTCTGTVNNPDAFTPTSDFTVNIGTSRPTVVPAYIQQNTGFAGIQINAGDLNGTISMTTGSTISAEVGLGLGSDGMVVRSYADGQSRTYSLDLDGSISSDGLGGDALRLEGTSSAVFNATIGQTGHLGSGDAAVAVTGAQSLLLNNYGVLEGGSAYPLSAGNGVSVGDANGLGERIAAEGITINNYGTIEGAGSALILGGQGIIAFGAGDVTISNSQQGNITGSSQGIHVEANGIVSITNDGHIEGKSSAGVEIADATTANVTNGSPNTIIGATDGLYIHNADNANVDNDQGHIVGQNGDGVRIDSIQNAVTVQNRYRVGENSATIEGSSNGLSITNVGGDITVDNSAGGKIIGHFADSIHIRNADSDVAIDNSFGGTVSGGDDGVLVRDVGRDVSINNSFGGSISGSLDDGIDVRDVSGEVAISNDLGGSISGGDDGISARRIQYDLRISNDLGGTIAGDRNGIDADRVRDDVTISNVAGRITGGNRGIDVSNVGEDLRVENTIGGTISGNNGDGIRSDDTEGRVFINNTILSSIAGHDDGVHLRHTDGNASISNRFGSQISGESGNGIDIYDAGDGVRITNDFGSTISGNVNGVKAGDVRGNVTLSNVAASISGGSESGVDISSVRGDVEIRNALGSIHGGNDGIRVSDVDGNIAIQNAIGSGISGDRESGIDIGGGGRVAIDNAGVIAGLTNAITIESGTAQINSSGLISGSGESDSVIKISTTAGATINNNEGGVIRGFLMSPSDLAIEASGGEITINNAGTIWGRVDLSSAGNTDTPNVFNNSSNNSWHVLGTSNLGNGLADSFNNTGTVYVTDPDNPAAGDVTVITGVESFNNGGPSGAGTIDLQDGHTGDVFMLSPSTGGSLVFNGAPGQSVLKVDSFLGTASDSTTDSLVVNGSVTGSTAIQINNINPSFGSFNPVGANVVSATGSLPPNSFYLSGGPIDTGMFTYDLFRKGPEEWVLASAPNHAFFELPSITSAAQSIWHSVAGGWLDRTADLRTALEGTCDVGSLKDPTVGCKKPASGAWAKVLGSSESRSTGHSFTVLNTTQRTSVDTQLEGGGVIGGYDFIRSTDDGSGIWLAGVMGGYLRSNLDFNSSPTGAKFEGGAVGGYLTYLRGGWFLDGQVLANVGSVDYSGSFSEKDHSNVTSIGGVLDTGYRVAYGSTFIEPGATLSYVNSGIGDLSLYGTGVDFTNGDSLRGRIGMRLGTTIVKETAKYEPFLGISGLYEFLGDNKAEVMSGGYTLQATDNLTGALGEVSGGLNVFSLTGNGLSAFAKGGVQFGKDDYLGYGGTLGVRVDW